MNDWEALALMTNTVNKGKPFDLVIIDVDMPSMRGEALGRAIRDFKLLQTPPMVMLTS